MAAASVLCYRSFIKGQSYVQKATARSKDSLVIGPQEGNIIWHCHAILVITENLLVCESLLSVRVALIEMLRHGHRHHICGISVTFVSGNVLLKIVRWSLMTCSSS